MRKYFIAAIVSLFAGLTLLAPTSPARAAEIFGPAISTSCPNLKNFYVNDDEGDRKPGVTPDGLKFSGDQLAHHVADVSLADLKPGAYVASPTPDQPSFFSVEVSDPTTNGYGTLRWNTDTQMWDLTTNLGQFSHADPVDFVGTDTKWGKLTATTRVSTFGIGYTANPPGTKTVVVSEVIFGGEHFPLTCKPPVTLKPTVKPKPSASTSHIPGVGVHTILNPPQNGPALAVTGPDGRVLGAGAAVLALLGGALLVVSRRRKTHFRA